jgi:hypothetical protein
MTFKGLSNIKLLAKGRRPRLHPNGFIQLDLTDNGSTRLHVWPDISLPAQKTSHPIHDHIFDMVSTVISGKLMNKMYESVPGNPSHELHVAERINGNDTILAATGLRGQLHTKRVDMIQTGQSYFVPAHHLHETIHLGLAATLMTKTSTPERGDRPHVAVPIGVEPDNDFRRETIDEEVLWSIIERATA